MQRLRHDGWESLGSNEHECPRWTRTLSAEPARSSVIVCFPAASESKLHALVTSLNERLPSVHLQSPYSVVAFVPGVAGGPAVPSPVFRLLPATAAAVRITLVLLPKVGALTPDEMADCVAKEFVVGRPVAVLTPIKLGARDTAARAATRVAMLAGADQYEFDEFNLSARERHEESASRARAIASLVTLDRTSPPDGSERRSVGDLHALLRWAFLTLPDSPRHSSVAELLRERGAMGHERESTEAGEQLESLVNPWMMQRLWSQNRVAELVVHDDRHAEQVDRHVADLVRHMPIAEKVSTRGLFLLGCAAWLHDWGHVGVPLGGWLPDSALDVRNFHGLLTQQLLVPEFSAMHGLDDATAKTVAVLSAHHQGWTSFGDETPEPRRMAEGDYPPLAAGSFFKDFQDLKNLSLRYEEARLLLAVLRLADAADVGRHRIPDYAARGDYRLLCLQREAVRTAQRLTAFGVQDSAPMRTLAVAYKSHHANLLRAVRDIDHPLARALADYSAFLDSTQEHYDKHHAVAWVSLTIDDGAIRPIVYPSSAAAASLALDVVDTMLAAELRRPTVDSVGALSVGALLASIGLIRKPAVVGI